MHSVYVRDENHRVSFQNLVTRRRSKKEDMRGNKARSDIKGAWRLSTLAFIFYTRGKRKNEREEEKTAWKAYDRKQKKSDKKEKVGDGYTDRWERRAKDGVGKGRPRFSVGVGKIFAYTPDLPSPISAARFLDIGSGISIFRSFASRSDFRTEPLLFPPCIQSPIPFPPFPSFLLYLYSRASVSLSFSFSFSLSLFLSPFLLPRFSSSRSSRRWRNVHQKIWILRRIVYDSVSPTFRHCARMTRGQRKKLRAVLNECEKKRRDGDDDGRNLHWCTETAFARI